jgi:hypothetical protein
MRDIGAEACDHAKTDVKISHNGNNAQMRRKGSLIRIGPPIRDSEMAIYYHKE